MRLSGMMVVLWRSPHALCFMLRRAVGDVGAGLAKKAGGFLSLFFRVGMSENLCLRSLKPGSFLNRTRISMDGSMSIPGLPLLLNLLQGARVCHFCYFRQADLPDACRESKSSHGFYRANSCFFVGVQIIGSAGLLRHVASLERLLRL